MAEPSPPARPLHFSRPVAATKKKTALPPPSRRLPIGAELAPGGVHFRVWAPSRKRVEVVFEEAAEEWPVDFELTPERDGYFSGLVPGAGAGALYRFGSTAATPSPTRPRASSPKGRTARRRWSIPPPSPGPTATGAASAAAAR